MFVIALTLMSAACLGSCGSHKAIGVAIISNNAGNIGPVEVDMSHISGARRMIVEEAITWVGTPYVYAGVEKGRGVDCSGMVMKVYEDAMGTKIPRNSAKQAEFCKKIKEKDVEAGDLVFFATGKDPGKVSHVGIMLDRDNFVHASSSKGVVISKVSAGYYTKRLLMYGRVPVTLLSGTEK